MNAIFLERLAPLAGIAAVALLIFGIYLTRPFDYYPSAARAHEFFSSDPARIQRGTRYPGFIGPLLIIVFCGSIFGALNKLGSDGGLIASIALAGGIITAIGLAIGNGILYFAATRAGRQGGISPDAAQLLYDFSTTVAMANILTIGLALMIGATGIGALRTQLFPAWFGWASLVLTAGLLTPFHYIFEGLAFIWIIGASVLLFFQG